MTKLGGIFCCNYFRESLLRAFWESVKLIICFSTDRSNRKSEYTARLTSLVLSYDLRMKTVQTHDLYKRTPEDNNIDKIYAYSCERLKIAGVKAFVH